MASDQVQENVNCAFSADGDPDAIANLDVSHVKESARPELGSPLENRRVSVTAAGDAVILRGAQKSFKSGKPVLKGLNMTVPGGSIYGLLGSSGCGKTTVLSCIVGQRKLDRGDIRIFGKRPGTKSVGVPGRNIGYMPQDISLYLEFSISETLSYFGTLSGLKKEQMKSAKSFLVKLLDLPDMKQRVATLSGGQQRRVSFATALIHQPALLILDEPTVGLDPLLRERIWMHLRGLTAINHTTVIVTTHYIEECRQADNIGILKNGRLLTERQPKELFSEHGTTNLENIVLTLSRKDAIDSELHSEMSTESTINNDIDSQVGARMAVKMASIKNEAQPSLQDSLVRVRALTEKNIVILLRNPLLLFFVVLISAAICIITCLSFGVDPYGMPLGVVNDEADYSKICLNITRVPGECEVDNLSCLYLSQISSENINLKIYDHVNDAIDDVHKGILWGYISFPSNFSINLYERFSLGSTIDDLAYNESQIVVRLDETNKHIASTIRKVLSNAFIDFARTLLSDCGHDPRHAESPLAYRKPLFGKDDADFREFMAPGFTSFFLFFFPVITTSIRFIKEKKSGTMARSMVGGVQTWEVMVAYSISEFLVLLCQSLLVYGVLALLFQIKFHGSHTLAVTLFLLCGYGGVSMGFMLGSFCAEEIEASLIAMASLIPNVLLSGLLWPVEGTPEVVQYFGKILPGTLPGEAIRSIISRGWEFTHPNVWPGFMVMLVYLLGFFLMTILYHKRIKK